MKGPITRIGFIGLGNMGTPMAVNLAKAGFDLSIYDSDPVAMSNVAGVCRASVCQRLADFVDREAIILMLPTGRVVRSVLLGESDSEGLVPYLTAGTVVIDMSSSAATGTRSLFEPLHARGIELIDAPVSGGVAKAKTATLAAMVGGPDAVIDAVQPLLARLASKILRTGGLGTGHAMKALNNYVSATCLAASCEAIQIADAFGIAPATALEVLNASTGRNNATENKMGQFILSRTYASGFGFGLMSKDVQAALDLARELQLEPTLLSQVSEMLIVAYSLLSPSADHTEIMRFIQARMHGSKISELLD